VIAVSLIIIISIFNKANATYTPGEDITESKVVSAFNILNDSLITKRDTYIDFLKNVELDYDLVNVEATIIEENKSIDSAYDGEVLLLQPEQKVTYEVNVNKSGYYNVQLDFKPVSNSLNNLTFSVKINDEYQFDESHLINVPVRWKDSTKEFLTDSYGDETLPSLLKIKEWTTIGFYNNTYDTVDPLYFYFEAGINSVEIENIASEEVEIGNLVLIAPTEVPTYDNYKTVDNNSGNFKEYINAISYVEKNSSYVRMRSVKEPTLTPFDPIDKKLNVIDSVSWTNSGQELTYEMNVPQSGNYNLAFYYQNSKNDFSVFRTFRIDGVTPFAELKAYEFPVTKGNNWELEVLSDKSDVPYEIYLEAGFHTLSITADYEPVAESVRNIQLVLDHINKFNLDIVKITGKDIDKSRNWNLTKYIPETDQYLEAYEVIIKDIIKDLQDYAPNKELSSTLSYLQKALYKLSELRKIPSQLPVYLEDLSTGSGSVAQMLGDSINMIKSQPLSLDGFFVYDTDEISAPTVGFFKRVYTLFASFVSSFTSDKFRLKTNPDVVEVWVNKPITYVDIMQKMADAEFTSNNGIKVKISVMPDANKLVLASAANQAPDVALGLASHMPFDLAIRNAAYDLTKFDNFWEVASDFAPGAFVPYVLNDSVYALPETLTFNSLIYRKDTFDALELEVPDTWDDVISLLPQLQRHGMNFYHPISGGDALKWFYQTSPFIYQMGGSIYNSDGLSATINSQESVEAITFLTSLFTTYSLPEQVPSFYNAFRYNELPVGIVDFGTYLTIKNAAPELTGQWELAPYPGTVQDDGTINRSYIANGSSGLIMETTDKPAESWKFLSWWMSTNIQAEFANTLQSTYGPEYVWLSGNLKAVESSPIEKDDLDIILEQVKWLVDVPRTPGQYMLERGLSDIWNTAVFDNTPTGVAIDKQIITINREIKRKMVEFGYIDTNGKVLEPYTIRDVEWVKSKMVVKEE
jgi:ABC-type glycerol-3-phosphate transport system substrate-binding protein